MPPTLGPALTVDPTVCRGYYIRPDKAGMLWVGREIWQGVDTNLPEGTTLFAVWEYDGETVPALATVQKLNGAPGNGALVRLIFSGSLAPHTAYKVTIATRTAPVPGDTQLRKNCGELVRGLAGNPQAREAPGGGLVLELVQQARL